MSRLSLIALTSAFMIAGLAAALVGGAQARMHDQNAPVSVRAEAPSTPMPAAALRP